METGEILSEEFEYGVILNGSQTGAPGANGQDAFEYGVILNGSQFWRRGVCLSMTSGGALTRSARQAHAATK